MPDLKYQERRAETDARFAAMHALDENTKVHQSPSGRYSLQITEYTTGQNSWNYTRGLVLRNATSAVVADVKRNYGVFWFAWVQRKDKEYLLCGEDYQGYNVIDLDAEVNATTFPPEAYKGQGFCWATAYPSPTGDTIAVEGCYWACPYELVFYDFTNPAQSPLPEISRIEDLDRAQGWINEVEFRFSVGESEARQTRTWQRKPRE
ncbi:hypothetical protein DW355_02215 [Hylemonella gracilis]|jgi:hypothetical protein|uniref:Uncharacterized protein n=1 Tax=Hylemonella gracilis TaxID=80880 RepID=A0A4P6UG06_9BURK|nr:hypothetical protein [Hylemonella gracilis]QBK03743.1 hypothetical protein DW355_02215 [Hylemonella gracilis]